MILNIAIAIVLYINVANAGMCRDFNKCKDMLPSPTNDSCADIKKKMADVMNCLDQTGACDDLGGAGVINGMCIANMAYYDWKNCSFSSPDEACGLANHTNFNVEYTNNQTHNFTNCAMQYPLTCDEKKFAVYASCIKLISTNNFTKGTLQGRCLQFRAGVTECNFNETTCKIVTFERIQGGSGGNFTGSGGNFTGSGGNFTGSGGNATGSGGNATTGGRNPSSGYTLAASLLAVISGAVLSYFVF